MVINFAKPSAALIIDVILTARWLDGRAVVSNARISEWFSRQTWWAKRQRGVNVALPLNTLELSKEEAKKHVVDWLVCRRAELPSPTIWGQNSGGNGALGQWSKTWFQTSHLVLDPIDNQADFAHKDFNQTGWRLSWLRAEMWLSKTNRVALWWCGHLIIMR